MALDSLRTTPNSGVYITAESGKKSLFRTGQAHPFDGPNRF
jgi:hypothetical protein